MGTTAQSPDAAALGHRDVAAHDSSAVCGEEKMSGEQKLRLMEHFLLSPSLEGKPMEKKPFGNKTHPQRRRFGVFEQSCVERQKVGAAEGTRLQGELLPQFLPTQFASFEFPRVNSTCTSPGETLQSTLVLQGSPRISARARTGTSAPCSVHMPAKLHRNTLLHFDIH